MNLKAFFVATLSSALELGIANADDVLRHVTPDVLSQHLPRPLWARMLTACLGAPRVDSQIVVETIGVANLCEHVPAPIIWACIAEIAARSLSGGMAILTRPVTAAKAGSSSGARPTTPATGIPMTRSTTPASGIPVSRTATSSQPTRAPLTPPPPDAKPAPTVMVPPKAVGPNIPSLTGAAGSIDVDFESEEDPVIAPPPAGGRPRTATGQRFRQSSTGIGRLANNQRRPQAQAAPPASGVHDVPTSPPRARRNQTDGDFELETEVSNKDDWKNALAVEDEQLVDWTAGEETVTHTDDFNNGRKR